MEFAGAIVQIFVQHGLAGAVALLAIWVAWKKDVQVLQLYERIVTIGERHVDKVMDVEKDNRNRLEKLLRDTHMTINTLTEVVQEIERERTEDLHR